MNGILKLRDNTDYQLRQTSQPLADSFHSVSNCSELASYLRPKIWEQIAFKLNMSVLLMFLKQKCGNL